MFNNGAEERDTGQEFEERYFEDIDGEVREDRADEGSTSGRDREANGNKE